MKPNASNIYEAPNSFAEEQQRLSAFNLPLEVSVAAIGLIQPGATLLDIGAGPNTSLYQYIQSHGGSYTALDKNKQFLLLQNQAGANTVRADTRKLPFDDKTFDITHARFVMSHLGADKQTAIGEMLRVTKTHGKAFFLDYDWATAHGSEVFNEVRDFMVKGDFLFDASFGSQLLHEIRKFGFDDDAVQTNYPPENMTDYSQVVKLREAGTTDLRMQGKEKAAEAWNILLDELSQEAGSNSPQGFFFPGITVVTVTKN